ncbi:MAG: dTDP-4-dehydrorhamnose 3,5-epimerase [Culicoidibacterales bacterium]
MKIEQTKIKDLIVITPNAIGDHRGWFCETYNQQAAMEAGISQNFIQDNHSFSAQIGTLRGLHYQLAPKAQTKLVRCTKGAIFDVAVDLRQNSPTFGQWYGLELSAENKKQLLVPQGFAHGFMTITSDAEVQYKVDQLYSKEHDSGILWSDPAIGIKWPLDVIPVLSEKDKIAPLLKDAKNNF